MRLDISELIRLNTCGFLHKNKWDYCQKKDSSSVYLVAMKEVLRWHYKRNKPIDPESFMTFLFNLNNRMGINYEERIALESAFRKFINSDFYINLKNVQMNYLTDIKINKTDVLEYSSPCFINNYNKPTFIYYENEQESKKLFLEKYEVMHNAVWTFYNLGKNASYIRIWFDKTEIKKEVFKINDEYILRAKRNLLTIGRNTNMFILPPIQTCKDCSMISEGDRFSYKKDKKRGINVTATN
jgi:hypothetical protein